MSDYCTDDGLPDEDAVFNVLLNANNPILLKGAGELVMLSGNATFLRRIAGQTFSQKIIVFCRNQGTELERLQQQNTKFGSNRWCELSSSSDVSIIKVNASVPVDSVSGFKALLKALEDFPAGKVYVTTEVPIICSGVISNAYAALRDEDTSFVIPEGVLGEQEWTEYLANRSLEANDIWVLANYDRFKGSRRAIIEVHGGASLEEVVVPVIRITLANEAIECHVLGTAVDEVATIIKPLDGPTVMPVYCSKPSASLFIKIKGKTYPAIRSEINPLEFSVDL